jgi:hypothetical protein
MNRTTKRAWMAIPLALALAAAAGCMADHGMKEMSDKGMEPGMSKSGMSDRGTMDNGMTTDESKGGM